MLGNKSILKNGLAASIDWIAFTSVVVKDATEMFDFLGYEPEDFLQLPKGANGYMKVYRLRSYPVSVMTEGNENMGVHVVITGSAIRDVLEHYRRTLMTPTPFGDEAMAVSEFGSTVMCEFLGDISRIGWLTRLDLAVDDRGCSYFSVEDFRERCRKKDVVSKFRSMKSVEESTLLDEKTGMTVYLGSRQSEVMLRVYDKRLEQNKKAETETDRIQDPWIRWEIELKDERANIAADMIVKQVPLGQVVMGVLNNYVRVIIQDDSNRTRCSTDPLWERFIDAVGKLRLYVAAAQKTIREKRHWLIRSVLPTLAGVILADGGCFDIITQHFDDAVIRMNSHMRYLVTQQNPDWEDDFRRHCSWA